MTAVIYARYSSDAQREESIEGQIRECTAFAEKNGFTVLRHYIDRAFSAKTDNRPEFQNMIKDSNKKLFDVVIVWKLDRFARNRYDSARYKSVLKKNGVKVVSATEIISDGAEGIILESVLEGYAEYYSADLAEKVVRGMTENALKCKFNGGAITPGYMIDSDRHFKIDPMTAPLISEAFTLYDDGKTISEICNILNQKGLRTAKGSKINFNNIQHILHNRRYIGEFRYRDIVNENGIPPIVPRDLFDRVQEKLDKNKKAPARHKAEVEYLLTTKLFCGHCGAYMCGESGTGRSGEIYHYYKCVSVKKKRAECHKKAVKKQWIEDIVVNELKQRIDSDNFVDAVVSMVMDIQDRENTALPLLQKQLAETKLAINNILNAMQQGVLTKSTKTRLEELEARQEEIEIQIANEQISAPKLTPDFVRMWIMNFREININEIEYRKLLIDSFLNAVFVYDDKIVIGFNYEKDKVTLKFEELEKISTDLYLVKNEYSGSNLDCISEPSLGNENQTQLKTLELSRVF